MRIANNTEHEIEIERSRFITYLFRVFDKNKADEYLSEVRKKHPFANHHCSAYICQNGMVKRAHDDGEPQGTAGKPILDVLEKNELEDILAVVVRYFGGIKLGAGGLIRAYSKSASETLKQVKLTSIQSMHKYELLCDYENFNRLEYLIKDIIFDISYDEEVKIIIMVKDDSYHSLINEVSKGKIIPKFIETVEIEI